MACSSRPSSPISSRNSTPWWAVRSRPAPVSGRAGEGAFLVAEQGRGGAVAAQRGAIDLDELALDLMAGFLQFVHAPSQMRLARAGRAGQQDGRLRAHRHSFDLFDQFC